MKPKSNHMDNSILLLCGRTFVTFSCLLSLTKNLKCFKIFFTDLTQPQTIHAFVCYVIVLMVKIKLMYVCPRNTISTLPWFCFLQVWAIQYKSWPICKNYIVEIRGSDYSADLVSFNLYGLSIFCLRMNVIHWIMVQLQAIKMPTWEFLFVFYWLDCRQCTGMNYSSLSFTFPPFVSQHSMVTSLW